MVISTGDPIKFCLQAMNVQGQRKRGLKDPLPTLNQAKVKLSDGNSSCLIACIIHVHFSSDAIIARFSMEKFNETAAKVRTQTNQKCSDLATHGGKKTRKKK